MNHLLGTLGFMRKRKMRREDKKKKGGTSWELTKKKKRMAFHMKLKESKRVAAVIQTYGSFSVLPECEDKRLECIKLTGSPNPTTSEQQQQYVNPGDRWWIYWGACWCCDRSAPLNRADVLRVHKQLYSTPYPHSYCLKLIKKEKYNICYYYWMNNV